MDIWIGLHKWYRTHNEIRKIKICGGIKWETERIAEKRSMSVRIKLLLVTTSCLIGIISRRYSYYYSNLLDSFHHDLTYQNKTASYSFIIVDANTFWAYNWFFLGLSEKLIQCDACTTVVIHLDVFKLVLRRVCWQLTQPLLLSNSLWPENETLFWQVRDWE